ncbi:MAG: transposase, partial [Pirellulales bacterium]
MATSVRYVGMDVHKESITLAVAEQGRDAAKEFCTVPNDLQHVLKALARLGAKSKLRCCYEAGPTGYALYRELAEHKIDCVVVAPSLVPIQAANRLKTDRRDAVKLAHFLRSGDLTTVYVPDEATEALRDLERARDDATCAERAARHQLSKFLLRHGRRFSGGGAWTQKHFAWLAHHQRLRRIDRQAGRPPHAGHGKILQPRGRTDAHPRRRPPQRHPLLQQVLANAPQPPNRHPP